MHITNTTSCMGKAVIEESAFIIKCLARCLLPHVGALVERLFPAVPCHGGIMLVKGA
jgi:hypothetical protein